MFLIFHVTHVEKKLLYLDIWVDESKYVWILLEHRQTKTVKSGVCLEGFEAEPMLESEHDSDNRQNGRIHYPGSTACIG